VTKTTSKFRQVRAAALVDPAFRAAVAKERALMAEIDIAAARRTTGMTQEAVASALGTTQENVSRIERQRDVRLSTLVQFVQAQGGDLEVTAIFDGKRVPLMSACQPVGPGRDPNGE
jgi:DNA-binding transcriptional regulator YiaG